MAEIGPLAPKNGGRHPSHLHYITLQINEKNIKRKTMKLMGVRNSKVRKCCNNNPVATMERDRKKTGKYKSVQRVMQKRV